MRLTKSDLECLSRACWYAERDRIMACDEHTDKEFLREINADVRRYRKMMKRIDAELAKK